MGCALNIGRMLSGPLLPGQYFDAESGFSDNGFRTYDASLGAYLQPDRIGVLKDFGHDPELQVAVEQLQINTQSDDAGLNQPYTYVSGNPVTYIDPYGLFGQTVPGAPSGGHGPMGGMGRSLGDILSGPGGNFYPGFSKQDWVCSLPNIHTARWGDVGLGSMADKCVLDRCIRHDHCYEDNKCNMSSWGSSILGGTKSCNKCNSGFFD